MTVSELAGDLHRPLLSCCRRLLFDDGDADDENPPQESLDSVPERQQQPRSKTSVSASTSVSHEEDAKLDWMNFELCRKCLYYNFDFFNDRPLALPPHFTDWEWEPLVDGPQFYFKPVAALDENFSVVDESVPTVEEKVEAKAEVDVEPREEENEESRGHSAEDAVQQDLPSKKQISAAKVGEKDIARIMKTPAKKKRSRRRNR